jgi:hypothetical protein
MDAIIFVSKTDFNKTMQKQRGIRVFALCTVPASRRKKIWDDAKTPSPPPPSPPTP